MLHADQGWLQFEDLGPRQVVVDRSLGLTARLAQAFTDRRDARYCDHSLHHHLARRLYGCALGYDDLNDHDILRRDPLLAVA